MLKLTQQEKKYVEAALALPKTYLGNIFFDCSEDSIASLSDDIEKTLSQRKDARNAWIIASRHAGKEASKKIWRGEQKAVEDLESSLRKEVHRSGIKCWLAENMIFQIHRPDTVGNKWDYTGMDDKKDAHYAKHPLFVKFENAKEYVEMNEAFDDKETYAKWFKKNEKFISELNVQHARQ